MAFITTIPLSTASTARSSSPFVSNAFTTQHVSPTRRARFPSIPRMDVAGNGIYNPSIDPSSVRVVIFGATGYIGRYVVFEFVRQGYQVVAFARPRSGVGAKSTEDDVRQDMKDAHVIFGDVTNRLDVSKAFQQNESNQSYTSTIIVSCLASRTGGINDSNLIDYQATLNTLEEGYKAGANHFILLSAVCVSKPLLEFQRAKLKFESQLKKLSQSDNNFSYSIVRPTAFFKSLASQVNRLKKGSAFVMFGDGELCKCNAISESDLAKFMVLCANDISKRNEILPIGGPGNAVTPKEQAEILFRLLDKKPKYISLPIGIMDGAIGVLDFLAKFLPFMKDAAEFGKIGKYYAVEDMVGPSFGEDTLEQFFSNAIKDGGMEGQDLGDAAIL